MRQLLQFGVEFRNKQILSPTGFNLTCRSITRDIGGRLHEIRFKLGNFVCITLSTGLKSGFDPELSTSGWIGNTFCIFLVSDFISCWSHFSLLQQGLVTCNLRLSEV